MSCFSPLSAWQTDSGEIVFAERGKILRSLELPCGQCMGCRLRRSRDWAVRCMHEAQMHDESCFITLTYNDENVPEDRSLRYPDFQLFMRRLRKHFATEGKRVRFFMCGEYGEKRSRPHFHACLFGCQFPDAISFKRGESGCEIYTSEILSSFWKSPMGVPLGYASVGALTFDSAAYVARYVTKKVFGDVADATSAYLYVDDYGEVHYREPEFAHMSLKPGIGAGWFARYYGDVFPRDHVIVEGRKLEVPKYYDKLLAASLNLIPDPDDISFRRYKNAVLRSDDATPERLRVREEVTIAKLNFKRRTLR